MALKFSKEEKQIIEDAKMRDFLVTHIADLNRRIKQEAQRMEEWDNSSIMGRVIREGRVLQELQKQLRKAEKELETLGYLDEKSTKEIIKLAEKAGRK